MNRHGTPWCLGYVGALQPLKKECTQHMIQKGSPWKRIPLSTLKKVPHWHHPGKGCCGQFKGIMNSLAMHWSCLIGLPRSPVGNAIAKVAQFLRGSGTKPLKKESKVLKWPQMRRHSSILKVATDFSLVWYQAWPQRWFEATAYISCSVKECWGIFWGEWSTISCGMMGLVFISPLLLRPDWEPCSRLCKRSMWDKTLQLGSPTSGCPCCVTSRTLTRPLPLWISRQQRESISYMPLSQWQKNSWPWTWWNRRQCSRP